MPTKGAGITEGLRSSSDPDSRLARKGDNLGAKPSYLGKAVMENRSGLVVEDEVRRASGPLDGGACMKRTRKPRNRRSDRQQACKAADNRFGRPPRTSMADTESFEKFEHIGAIFSKILFFSDLLGLRLRSSFLLSDRCETHRDRGLRRPHPHSRFCLQQPGPDFSDCPGAGRRSSNKRTCCSINKRPAVHTAGATIQRASNRIPIERDRIPDRPGRERT